MEVSGFLIKNVVEGAPDETPGRSPGSTPPTVSGLTDDRAVEKRLAAKRLMERMRPSVVHGVDQVGGILHQALIPGLGFLQLLLLAVDFLLQAGGKLPLIAEVQHHDGAGEDHQADDHLQEELAHIEGMDHAFHFAGRGHHRHRPGGGRFILLDQGLVSQLHRGIGDELLDLRPPCPDATRRYRCPSPPCRSASFPAGSG